MGVEKYTMGSDIALYKSSSVNELAELNCPDHAVAIVASTPDDIYYAVYEHSSEPNTADIEAAYRKIGSALTENLRNSGIYTKELQLTSSHPEIPIPKNLLEDFAEEKKPAFKACSLMWLWIVSEKQS